MKQTSFQKIKWAHRFSHGGGLRRSRSGRGVRPLTSKEPIHLVFKTNRGLSGAGLRSARRFALVQKLLRKYAWKFHVRIEQVSVQFDHIHLLVRITRRSLFQHFLRVIAGQVAQQFYAHSLGIRPPVMVAEARTKSTRTQERTNAKRSDVTDTPENRSFGRSKGLRGADDGPRSVASQSQSAAVKLWKHRPFTRVVRGWKAYRVVRDYIQLNEKEATGEIRYSSARLRGLLAEDLARLWV